MEPTAAHFIGVKRLGAVLDQATGPHVVVGADHQPAEGVHQREVPVSAVAGPEQILDQSLQSLVAQALMEMGQKLFLFTRPHVIEFVVRGSLLQQRVLFLLIGWTGVVEDDHPHRMAVLPKVFVVERNGLGHFTQAVGGNDED